MHQKIISLASNCCQATKRNPQLGRTSTTESTNDGQVHPCYAIASIEHSHLCTSQGTYRRNKKKTCKNIQKYSAQTSFLRHGVKKYFGWGWLYNISSTSPILRPASKPMADIRQKSDPKAKVAGTAKRTNCQSLFLMWTFVENFINLNQPSILHFGV